LDESHIISLRVDTKIDQKNGRIRLKAELKRSKIQYTAFVCLYDNNIEIQNHSIHVSLNVIEYELLINIKSQFY